MVLVIMAGVGCTRNVRENLNIAQLESEFNDKKVPGEAKLSHLLSALAYSQATFGPEDKKTRSILVLLAQHYSAQHEFVTAHDYWSKALPLCAENERAEIEVKITCLSGLIASQCAQGKCEDAEQSYRDLLRMRTELYGTSANQTLTTTKLLAETLQKKNRFSEATTLYEQAIKECPAHNRIFMNGAKLALARCYARVGKTKEASLILDELIASAREFKNGQQNPLISEAIKISMQLSEGQNKNGTETQSKTDLARLRNKKLQKSAK